VHIECISNRQAVQCHIEDLRYDDLVIRADDDLGRVKFFEPEEFNTCLEKLSHKHEIFRHGCICDEAFKSANRLRKG
jgi:hypothetical protein